MGKERLSRENQKGNLGGLLEARDRRPRRVGNPHWRDWLLIPVLGLRTRAGECPRIFLFFHADSCFLCSWSFPCFSLDGDGRRVIVSGNKRALTFKWHQSGALERGVGVVCMCNVSMYRSLRISACGGGTRTAHRCSWRRRRFRRRRRRNISSRAPNQANHLPFSLRFYALSRLETDSLHIT